MKEIIYLDTNFLNSFLAQINGGLPTIKSREEMEEIKDVSESSEGFKSLSSVEAVMKTGEFEIPLLFKTPSGEIKGIWKPGNFSEEKAIASQTEAAKQIISTQMHDNALEEFITYLDDNEFLKSENEIGSYIQKTENFKIVDFDFLVRMMQFDTLGMVIFEKFDKDISKIENEMENIPSKVKHTREYQQKKAELNSKVKKVKSKKDETRQEFEDIEKILKYLQSILPYSTFLIMDNAIVPLKSDFLREKGQELSFKYGNTPNLKITLLGKITSSINDIDVPALASPEAILELHEMLYAIFGLFNLIKKGDKIVSPVAIYFE